MSNLATTKRDTQQTGQGCDDITNTWFETETPFPILNPKEFPTNEGDNTVGAQLIADCVNSPFFNLTSGYSGLDQIVWFIARHARDAKINIVIGNEPSPSSQSRLPTRSKKLEDEMRDYWLEQGLSPRTNSSLLETIAAIESGRVKVKLHKEKFLHGKAYVTANAATFGSSNFSTPGLEKSRELNGRFETGTERYDEIKRFVEGCWHRSEDYSEGLLELLRQLQLHSTWQEALARSCAALIEGEWAKDLIPKGMISEFEKLWPHQKQGIAQALTVLETQGAVVVADPTGSGKTMTGAWLIRLAYNRMISRGGERPRSLIPVIISPSAVENNWYQILDEVGLPRQIIPQGIMSNSSKEASKRRLKTIEHTNLLAVDEIHNYYNATRNRSKILATNLAESRIFLTATPINRHFKDLISLMKLLGIEELDNDTFSKLKRIEKDINSFDNETKNRARNTAKKLVQNFMVRRTRSELKDLAEFRKNEYKLGERFANYPDMNAKEYDVKSTNRDNKIIEEIKTLVDRIKGIHRIKDLKLSETEKAMNRTDSVYLKGRIRGAEALAKWSIWNCLDSSPAALYEHIMGTQMTYSDLGIKGKGNSTGAWNSTNNSKLPIWKLNEELKHSDNTPKWVVDQDEFNQVKMTEMEVYEKIAKKAAELSETRLDSKLNLIRELYNQNEKILLFDSSIITLKHIEDKLTKQGYDVNLYTGSSDSSKKTRVKKAEALFGLDSGDEPRIGLLSDSMSEGINLQGCSILVNLTSPSTVKLAEQRAGRLDRMNSPHGEVSIYYPKRDSISSMIKDLLKQRHELVSDVLGSNLELPGDEKVLSGMTLEEIEMSHEEMTKKLGSDRNELFDAFHDVKQLIGNSGIISEEQYEDMRTSVAKVMSYIGIVQSDTPWCFFVIQTNKNWAPQWVLLDYSKKDATDGRGIITDVNEICKFLREKLVDATDLKPTVHADDWVDKYLGHVERYELNLLPKRRKNLLMQMNRIINRWQKKKVGYRDNYIAERLGELKRCATASSSEKLDLRQLASAWNDFYRDFRSENELNLSSSSRKVKSNEDYLTENPPNFEDFISRFDHIPMMEPIDPRTISMIAGIPKYSP